jgi:RHS repeat-associated protein
VYFHEDRLGSTEYITDDFGGNVLSYIDYDPWGVPTNKAVVMLGFRAVDLVAEYTGHPYDNVLSAYFAEARMYDAADRRFLAADIVKGTVTNPLTMVPYTYVLDNPLKYVDPLGLDAVIDAMAEEAIRVRLYGAEPTLKVYALAAALSARQYEDGVYHISQNYWQSWELIGYNGFYDWALDLVADVKFGNFKFEYNGEPFRFWVWKGNYPSLGAGAELGIYHGGDPHWLTGTNYRIEMSMKLYDQDDKVLIDWEPGPDEPQWWINGFNPKYPDLLAKNLRAFYRLKLSDIPGFFEAFYKEWGEEKNTGWTFDQNTGTAFLNFNGEGRTYD